MKKTAIITAAVLLLTVLSSCSGSFIDPGMMDSIGGGAGGNGTEGGSSGGGSGGGGSSGGGGTGGGGGGGAGGEPSKTFTSITDFATWLEAQPANTADTAYSVKLNVSSLGGYSTNTGSAGYVLNNNKTKYVSLDLFGSTFTSIGDRAFYECTSLTSVTIPNSVTSIVGLAFYQCTSLTSVTIPDSVTNLSGFSGCTSLTSVNRPDSVYIPDSVTNLSGFNGCTSITRVVIPASVRSIGSGSFSGCTSLTAINVSPYNPFYSSEDGILYSKFNGYDKNGLVAYPAGKTSSSFTIPNGVTRIEIRAFDGCTSLTSVTIGNNVSLIAESAFAYCTSLTVINVNTSNTSYTSENGVLYNKDKTTLVVYPAGKTSSSFTIPNSVTSIGEWAFVRRVNLVSITIPNSVTSIGEWAFGRCTSLNSVTIGNSVTSIGDYAFYGCSGFTSITIPNSVTSIGNYAFGGCTSLTSVTFQGTITSANFGSAFDGGSGSDYIGNLRTKYLASDGGVGTYTRVSGSYMWTKQP